MTTIDLDAFKSDIAASRLCNSMWSNLDELVECSDDTLTSFHHLSEEEICDVINAPSSSWKFNLVPTWLLKLCVGELTPVITKMVNLRLYQLSKLARKMLL